jgi:hypothetical protein
VKFRVYHGTSRTLVAASQIPHCLHFQIDYWQKKLIIRALYKEK